MADILSLIGIKEDPTFTRSQIVNNQEEVGLIIQSAEYLEQAYITRKILALLGDGDMADDLIGQMDADEINRGSEE